MESWTGWLVVVCWHFLLLYISSSHSLCHSHDSFALLHFKTSFTIINSHHYHCHDVYYPKTATWENGTDCCSWLGVTCHPISGRVVGLDLTCSRLSGEIHENSTLFRLYHLQSLNLAFNYFSLSPLSSPFGGLVSLTNLNLSAFGFEGEISSQISHLSKLQSLDLSFNYNQLRLKQSTWKRLLHNATVLRQLVLDETDMSSISIGSFNLSSSLVTLSLSDTGLRGKLTNDTLCLPKLEHLDLSSCELEGSIPASFSNLTHLTSLDLSFNLDLNGSIPSSLLTLPRLTFLNLRRNDLSGQIPNVFPKSNELEELDLSDNNLGGELPSTLSNLQHLTSLDLSNNNINGSIPSSLLALPRLTFLDLAANRFSGQIPNVFHQSNRFQELNLRLNNIGGELPSTLSNLQHLIHLYLSWNKLSGQIPPSLFDLPQLLQLDFANNKLEGPLPNKIIGFPNLTQLRLNNNLINGTIPSWCLSLPSLLYLDLSNNQFTGKIPAISSHSLQYLYLCYNKLHDSIPQSIFNLVNLTALCLSSNSFSFSGPLNFSVSSLERLYLSSVGLTEFPKLAGKVPMLIELDLSNNKLNGTVPKWLHEIDSLLFLNLSQNLLTDPMNQFSRNYQLRFLDISFNLLTGGISLSICNASSLEFLILSHNKLTDSIPSCLANSSSLIVLDLQMNNLYGTVPSNFSKNNKLRILNLNDNQLEGLLPHSLSNCKKLVSLNLCNNQIEDTFPHWLQALPDLEVLVLRANKLHGTIVTLKAKHRFPSLVIFDISSNNFSGPIPKAYIQNFEAMKNFIEDEVLGEDNSFQAYMEINFDIGSYTESVTVTTKAKSMTFNKVPTNFFSIDLSNNKFEGEIPNVIGELHVLKGLNLSHNRLIGPIPQNMGYLTNLESLDLSSNMLTGRIPTEFVDLNFLEVLNLSYNRLVGEIPQGKQLDTFLNDSYAGNSGLCGVPLSKKCSIDPEQHSPTSQKLWREEIFEFGWKPVAIGYGCGMVFGVGIGCCVFLTRKPQWLVRMVGG